MKLTILIMLGILSGVANIVPYLGPIIGCTVSSLVALMQYRSFDPVLNVVVLYFAIKLMDDLVIQPLVIGKRVHLHPMLLVITLIVGEICYLLAIMCRDSYFGALRTIKCR
ncbi:MAG: AI-2E family transporter [Dissulfurispiraceae bacterium]